MWGYRASGKTAEILCITQDYPQTLQHKNTHTLSSLFLPTPEKEMKTAGGVALLAIALASILVQFTRLSHTSLLKVSFHLENTTYTENVQVSFWANQHIQLDFLQILFEQTKQTSTQL
jgi:hypothetical protein